MIFLPACFYLFHSATVFEIQILRSMDSRTKLSPAAEVCRY
ncbi:hypothetical protein HMPREF1986_01583 [Oribacterium sp. oral taxon 078 str. F0263]|nr:hypothetical protein HMPREF1986_01583 [Oribacterium sp. oral taxon 078 str. F0263]